MPKSARSGQFDGPTGAAAQGEAAPPRTKNPRIVLSYFQPLRRKLPLLISGLLCIVLGAFGWLADRRLESTLLSAATDRLNGAGQRIGGMLDTQALHLGDEIVLLARDSTVVALLRSPARERSATADSVARRTPSAPGPYLVRSIWGRDCTLRGATDRVRAPLLPSWCPREALRHAAAGAAFAITPFASGLDTVRYAVVAAVVGRGADTLGYLAETRAVVSGESATLLANLIGRDGSILIGNSGGTPLWTDFNRAAAGPPASVVARSGGQFVDARGIDQLGVARPLARAPWTVWVQLPHAAVVAPARQTLRTIGLIALICVLIGGVGALVVSEHVAAPLAEIAHAADDVAAGNYGRRVVATRRDELGQLVGSFNAMAEKVQSTTVALQQQTMELQERMEEAQSLAEELELSNQELLESIDEASRARRDTAIAQSLLDDVMNGAPVGVGVFDRQLRYVRVNGALADMNGVALETHAGRRASAVGHSFGALAAPVLARVLDSGETLTDYRVTEECAPRRQWLASFFPVRGDGGGIEGVGVIAVDNTAHQELQAQLLQSQKMEAVGRLAGGVAHDFNNLLTVISSYSALALDALPSTAPLRADVEEIRAAADRAAGLTRQLLAFSRKQLMQPQVVSLNDVAADMERLLRRLIGEDVRLTMEFAEELGDVLADPGHLQQVILNLAVNARDAMPSGGELRIETANVCLSSELTIGALGADAGEYVTLVVSDTGSGMTADTQAHLFEPFYTTKPLGHGTGLGLSTVYGIVKQSGGDIHVQSSPGRGATFKLYFPRHHAPHAPHRRTPVGVPRFGGSETILLAEDDDSLRALATRVLRRAGYQVIEARTAREAIELGIKHRGAIDLLVTDVVMPELSGRTVAERLMTDRPGLRVLYMSGYTDDDVVRRGVIAAKTEFIQKPFTPDGLTKRIRDVLEGRSRVTAD